MNSFLLTISGVLFLLTCGLSMPKSKIQIGIVHQLNKTVKCDNNVMLFVPPINDKNYSGAAKCFQDEFETVKTKCSKTIMVGHAITTLERMVQKDEKCIFKNETVPFSSFLKRFMDLLQKHNDS